MMFCIGYLSSSHLRMNSEEVGGIVEKSVFSNKSKNITGMLCYFDNSFLQFIEGEERDVKELYEKIKNDTRHRGVIEVYSQPIKTRAFGNWSMALVSEDQISPEQLKFCQNLRRAKLDPTSGASHVGEPSELLDVFRLWIR